MYGTMLLFASICFVGFIFVAVMVIETKGLTDKEKKNIYDNKKVVTKSNAIKPDLF